MIQYVREILAGLWTLLVGMKLTLKYAASPTITTHYPFETLDITPNFRGHTDLVINAKTGKDKCIVCMMCQRTCPSQCITLEGEKPEGSKKRVLTEYHLDFTKCSLCGNCVEVCPTSALEYSNEYQLAGFSRHDFHFDLVDRFRERARALGVEPKIADLTPVPEKSKAKAAETESKAAAKAAARPKAPSKSDEAAEKEAPSDPSTTEKKDTTSEE